MQSVINFILQCNFHVLSSNAIVQMDSHCERRILIRLIGLSFTVSTELYYILIQSTVLHRVKCHNEACKEVLIIQNELLVYFHLQLI